MGVVFAGVEEFAVVAEAAEAGLFVAVFFCVVSLMSSRIRGRGREGTKTHSLQTSGAMSVIVIVLILLGALMGPTWRFGAFGFFCM